MIPAFVAMAALLGCPNPAGETSPQPASPSTPAAAPKAAPATPEPPPAPARVDPAAPMDTGSHADGPDPHDEEDLPSDEADEAAPSE